MIAVFSQFFHFYARKEICNTGYSDWLTPSDVQLISPPPQLRRAMLLTVRHRDAWHLVRRWPRLLPTRLQNWSILHWTRRDSLTHSARGWRRKCVIMRGLLSPFITFLCNKSLTTAAFRRSGQLSVRPLLKKSWLDSTLFSLLGNYRPVSIHCRFSLNYYRWSFRPSSTAMTWCQNTACMRTVPSTALKRHFPKCTLICCSLLMVDKSLQLCLLGLTAQSHRRLRHCTSLQMLRLKLQFGLRGVQQTL